MNQTHSPYSLLEEKIHAATHGVGVILSIAGLAWMLNLSITLSDPWRITASVVYGTSLIVLFLASTVYHTLHRSQYSPFYKILDHCAIYMLIAGSYTPFLLVAMRNETGWWLFGAIWILAVLGIVLKLRFHHRFPKLSMFSYLLMGWLVVLAAPQLADAIGEGGIRWVIYGGAAYTIGAGFYAAKWMPYHHVIWHLLVLMGAASHCLAVIWYVLPA